MRRLLTIAVPAATVLALTAPAAAHADSDHHHGRVRLCVAEGRGAITLVGDDASRQTRQLSNTCTDMRVPTGQYKATISKYLDGPCYRTLNGGVINPPQQVTNGARCPAKVHDITVEQRDERRALLRGDEVDVRIGRHHTTTVIFHVTDVNYPDCIDGPGAPNATKNVCAPTGPTT
jgi:hypothetical protein